MVRGRERKERRRVSLVREGARSFSSQVLLRNSAFSSLEACLNFLTKKFKLCICK